jgi:hypothetical protein
MALGELFGSSDSRADEQVERDHRYLMMEATAGKDGIETTELTDSSTITELFIVMLMWVHDSSDLPYSQIM